jgi:DNA polymerase III epsilon subunit-like protein
MDFQLYRTALIFDTETTGLVYAKTDLDEYPYITQLSFIVFDLEERKITRSFNEYIKIPCEVEIPPKVIEITKITPEICQTRGIPIELALKEFYQEYMRADVVVSHNLDFDTRIMIGEYFRNRAQIQHECLYWLHLFKHWTAADASMSRVRDLDVLCYKNLSFEPPTDKNMFCTMREGKEICRIWHDGKNGGRFIKQPKLVELHNHYFGRAGEEITFHNALVDTAVCLRCFLQMKYGYDVATEPNSGYNELMAPPPAVATHTREEYEAAEALCELWREAKALPVRNMVLRSGKII